jgi:hypothetical protein
MGTIPVKLKGQNGQSPATAIGGPSPALEIAAEVIATAGAPIVESRLSRLCSIFMKPPPSLQSPQIGPCPAQPFFGCYPMFSVCDDVGDHEFKVLSAERPNDSLKR